MLEKTFQKRKEHFECENCGTAVTGDGYTNHCNKCLWSKHVDINPGDRAANCGGLMEPIQLEVKSGEYVITHRCICCSHTKRNRTSKNDDFEAVLKLASLVSARN